jgi:hypothetical protein
MARPEDTAQAKAWEAWYRLARHSLACRHEEAVEYANLRFVEEQNRVVLRRDGAERTARRRS